MEATVGKGRATTGDVPTRHTDTSVRVRSARQRLPLAPPVPAPEVRDAQES